MQVGVFLWYPPEFDYGALYTNSGDLHLFPFLAKGILLFFRGRVLVQFFFGITVTQMETV